MSAGPDPVSALSAVALVASYPRTEPGLARYTANLRAALAVRLPSVGVVGWADAGMTAALEKVAEADAVVLQHEFGVEPGSGGVEVVEFAAGCRAPVFTVMHTVLNDPTARQRDIIDTLAVQSRLIVVHTAVARGRLLGVHGIDPRRIVIVPHGAVPNHAGNVVDAPPHAAVKPLVLTWGLLRPGKGVEHGIEAIALLRMAGLDVRYLVAGETHPAVRSRDGERYRDELQALARRRGVGDLVEFDGVYRDDASLRAVVRRADIVLLPYDSHEQVTSGVLVEALAAGKPVVATAFPHAVELSGTGAVAVVAHESPGRCAAAISAILEDAPRRLAMEAAARREGARCDWAVVADRFVSLMTIELELGAQAGQPIG